MAVVSLSCLNPKSLELWSFTFLGLDQTLNVKALMAASETVWVESFGLPWFRA